MKEVKQKNSLDAANNSGWTTPKKTVATVSVSANFDKIQHNVIAGQGRDGQNPNGVKAGDGRSTPKGNTTVKAGEGRGELGSISLPTVSQQTTTSGSYSSGSGSSYYDEMKDRLAAHMDDFEPEQKGSNMLLWLLLAALGLFLAKRNGII